jgi:hypothetical protein
MELKLSFSDSRDAFMFKDASLEGTSVYVPQLTITKGLGFTEPVDITITVASSVSIGLLTNWLYDKFKNSRSRKISINRKEIHIDKGEITKTIKESIKIKE